MSNSATLTQVRERVLQLAREIEDLSGSAIPEEVFFTEFLRRLVLALGAQAGTIWLASENRQLRLAYELNLLETGYRENQAADQLNGPLLNEVASTGQARLFGAGENPQFGTPTPHLFVMGPILRNKECYGVVQIFQRGDAPVQARPGYLQFIEQMCGHASRYLRLRQEASAELSPQEYLKKFQDFTLDLQRSLALNDVASTAANDGRMLIRCDRVSIAVKRGKKTTVKAISGQDHVNQRANMVRTLRLLTDRVIAAKEPLSYTGSLEKYPPQIEKPLADYVHESGSRCLIIVPLFPPVPPTDALKDEKSGKSEKNRNERWKRPIGALIVEQVTDSRPRPGMMEKIKLVAEHSAAALNNSISHESLFLLPVWRAIGSVVEALRGRTLAKVIAGTVALLILVAAMIWMKWDYRVEGKGRLMPIVKRDIFAAREGRVTKVLVTSGQRVTAGAPVVELENEDIRARLLAAKNELNERRKEANGIETELGNTSNTNRTTNKEDVIRLEGKLKQTRIAILGAETQVTILSKMREDLTIRAPIDGVIATFDPDKMLLYRPVQQGELLLEVMDTNKDWHLELDVPEHRLGHILRAQEREKDEKLPVEFLLATETEVTYQGTLGPIATRANVSDEQGTVIEVYADISPEDKVKLKDKYRIGAEVRAKINCGPYSLWYVLFGDVLEFVRKRLWF